MNGELVQPQQRAARRVGISLIEVMISLVLVSTILLVAITASANLLRNNTLRRGENQGQQLAAQFLDEVSCMDFQDRVEPLFGLESDEDAGDRTTFDDVDDFHGYSSSPPVHRDGTAITGYQGWSISVNVAPADADTTGVTTATSNTDSPLRLITVVCTTPEGTTVQATTLVSNVPDNNSEANSFERWRRVKLTFPDRELNITAPLRNNPDSQSMGI